MGDLHPWQEAMALVMVPGEVLYSSDFLQIDAIRLRRMRVVSRVLPDFRCQPRTDVRVRRVLGKRYRARLLGLEVLLLQVYELIALLDWVGRPTSSFERSLVRAEVVASRPLRVPRAQRFKIDFHGSKEVSLLLLQLRLCCQGWRLHQPFCLLRCND